MFCLIQFDSVQFHSERSDYILSHCVLFLRLEKNNDFYAQRDSMLDCSLLSFTNTDLTDE